MPTPLMLFLGLCLLCAFSLLAHRAGVRQGEQLEYMRFTRILHAAVDVVGPGGRLRAIWQCLDHNISIDEMRELLVENRTLRERERERLKNYEAKYGREV